MSALLDPVDVNATLAWFVEQTKAWVPWLADGPAGASPDTGPDGTDGTHVWAADPGVPYPGPWPFGVWIGPRLSVAHREAGELGNIKGEPNSYVLSYREAAYVGRQATIANQSRVYDTYSVLANHLFTKDGTDACPPTGQSNVSISLEHASDGIYIVTNSGPFIGALIIVRLEERYPNGDGE